MILTNKEILKSIETLRSNKPTDLGYFNSDEFHAWVNPRTYFMIKNDVLSSKAISLNEKHGRDIFDRRTKGYKLIKEAYESFIHNDFS